MKLAKLGIALLAGTLLAGCGNGFEGTYTVSTEGVGAEVLGAMNQMMQQVTGQSITQQTITIGSDYIETNGKRQKFKKIFERDTDNVRYLVFQQEDGQETVMVIKDDKTLVQDMGIVKQTLHKK